MILGSSQSLEVFKIRKLLATLSELWEIKEDCEVMILKDLEFEVLLEVIGFRLHCQCQNGCSIFITPTEFSGIFFYHADPFGNSLHRC